MNRSFRRRLRQREKTARRNNTDKRGLRPDPDLAELIIRPPRALEIRTPGPITGIHDAYSPAIVELIPPTISASGERTRASYRVIEGQLSPEDREKIELSVRKMNDFADLA